MAKVSKTFSLDVEIVAEMDKRGYGSDWVNDVLRKALGLKEKGGEE